MSVWGSGAGRLRRWAARRWVRLLLIAVTVQAATPDLDDLASERGLRFLLAWLRPAPPGGPADERSHGDVSAQGAVSGPVVARDSAERRLVEIDHETLSGSIRPVLLDRAGGALSLHRRRGGRVDPDPRSHVLCHLNC